MRENGGSTGLEILIVFPYSIFWNELGSITIYRYLDLVLLENFENGI